MSRKQRNWYQNEVDEEIKGVDSRDTVKHNERSGQLFLAAEQEPPWKISYVLCSMDLYSTGSPQ